MSVTIAPVVATRAGVLRRFTGHPLALFGFIIVGVFAFSWALSALVYRIGGYDNLEIKAEA